MTEMERRALMGDREAQEECTRQGIVLRCPCCKCEAETLTEQGNFTGEGTRTFYYVRCKSCFTRSASYTSKIAADSKWNTRPAPPVGRCSECKHWAGLDGYGDGYCKNPTGIDDIAKETDFCSYFEPKGDEKNV